MPFLPSFLPPTPILNLPHPPLRHPLLSTALHAIPSCTLPSSDSSPSLVPRYSRRAFITTISTLLSFSVSAHLEQALPSPTSIPPLQSLKSIRLKVNDIDPLITAAKWDSVRTVLARQPLLQIKDVCNELVASVPEDFRGAIIGLREDSMSAVRLLDTSVYSNVFIGEDRQILGTKVDFDVPRVYLADLKDALDSLIDIAEAA